MQCMQYGWRSRRLRLLAIGANDLHIMQDDSLPMPLANYDPIRNGLRNLKADASSVHPIEQAQRKVKRRMALSMHLYPHDEAAELLLYLHQLSAAHWWTCGLMVVCLQQRQHGFDHNLQQLQQAYGLALPARMQIEAQIVNKCAILLSVLFSA